MLARRLQYGDEIRIIAPSRSLGVVDRTVFQKAMDALQRNYTVTFSEHCGERDSFDSSSIASRAADLHEAFLDKHVKAVLACIGGFNCNQLLCDIEYGIIKNNPKILCGFSDITALLNAVYAKTGLVTYHGMMFTSFGYTEQLEYNNRVFEACVQSFNSYSITPSALAGEYTVLRPGYCEGVIVGGNLCTLNLLQGTPYMPDLEGKILFLEDDNIMGDFFLCEFDRNLQSLLQVTGGDKIKGLVFGRFDESCNMSAQTMEAITASKPQLGDIPILYGVDFGHIPAFATFPIGGRVRIDAAANQPSIQVLEH